MKLKITIICLFVSIIASAQQSTLIGLAKKTSNGKAVHLAEIDPSTGEVSILSGTPISNHLVLNGATLNTDGNQFCYSSPGLSGELLNVVDAVSGDLVVATNVALPANSYFDAIHYNCSDGFFYGIYRTSTTLKSAKIDAMTGAVTILSQASLGTAINFDYTLDKENNLYIVKMDSEIKSIDLSTGNLLSSTPINLSAGDYFENMAYSCADDILYGTMRNSSGIRFAKVDRSTGAVTILSLTSFATSYMMGAGSLLDDAEGKYYFNTGSEIVTVDVASGNVLYNEPLSYSSPGTYYLYYIQKYSNCTCPGILSIDEAGSGNSASVYPNPASDFITVKSTSNTLESIRIVDTYGREVMLKEVADFSDPVQLDISELATGIYFIQLVSENKMSRFTVVR